MGEQQTNDHKKNGKLKNKSDDESVGYNSNIGYNQNQGMNVNGFGNNNGPQPPPANMNMGGGDKYNGGYNNGINITSHQKSKSRVLPRTIKNKKFPPKPAKNMIKKRNKGINRSRTQPLPDNQNGGGKNNMNMNGNGMNGMNMNNGQMMNGGMNNKPIQNTTNFADLNFNAGQQFQSQQHPQSTNFMHGKTTYTSQW